ncbi:uncharacterized protein LOC126804567, partial [Argentina anserina]|uniref:uncharacterized protein LOC126804567 n=1 Tax=Argentina anserina TaxID=57926 RepID=UPI0021765B7B
WGKRGTPTATQIVEKLKLNTHPEGAFFYETFRDISIVLPLCQLPPDYKVERPVSTSIYFLLPAGNVSRLHRIPCAETWHFYLGEPLTVCSRFVTERLKFRIIAYAWNQWNVLLHLLWIACLGVSLRFVSIDNWGKYMHKLL